jgi:hypothetical protein
MPDLLERLRHLPPHTPILLISVARDAGGARFKSDDAGPLITAVANAPVFGLYDVYLNHGEVGGYLSSLSEQGKVAGDMALRLLGGAKPQDIPRVNGVNTDMFDWRALKRWGLRKSDLPPGRTVIGRMLRPMSERTFFAIAWFIIAVVLTWSAVARRELRLLLISAACLVLALGYLLRK